MEEKPIFCDGEGGTFPVNQFRRDQNGNLCVPYIHEVSPPHESKFGTPVWFSGCAGGGDGGGSGGGGGGGGGGGMMPGRNGIPDVLAAPMD